MFSTMSSARSLHCHTEKNTAILESKTPKNIKKQRELNNKPTMCNSSNNVKLFRIKDKPIWLCRACFAQCDINDVAKEKARGPQKGLTSMLGEKCECVTENCHAKISLE